MKVMAKLYATLRQFAPEDNELGAAFEVEYNGETIGELIQHLGISSEQAKIVMVNGNRMTDLNFILSENDLVVLFPPIGGG